MHISFETSSRGAGRGRICAILSMLLLVVVVVPATAQTTYVVAFNQTSGLPGDVDKLVAAAGGTITTRIPEIGGIAVTSSNPNFATQMAQSSEVKSADIATQTKLIDPVPEPGITSASDNGGSTASFESLMQSSHKDRVPTMHAPATS